MKLKPSTLAEIRQTTAWGLRPEVMSVVRDLLANGDVPGDAPVVTPQALERLRAAETSDVPVTGGVAVIPLKGVITARASLFSMLFGGGGLRQFRSWFREAVDDDEIGSIVLDVDSPGGSVDLIAETAAEIRAARGEKPIVAVANTRAASAAYWLAAQADELVVTPSGEVGSIGVFALHWDESGLNEKMGISPTYVSAGKFKTEGNPDEPLSEEAEAYLQLTIDEVYDDFVNDVALGRNVSADAVRNGFGEGRMVSAKRAIAAGMADRIETYEGAIARLAGTAQPSTPEPITARSPEPAEIRGLQLARPRHIQSKED